MGRLNSRNAYYNSVQNLLSSCILAKNFEIKMHETIILPVVLYGCETLSLTLRVEHWLRVFEKKVLRRIPGPKRKCQEAGEDCIMRNFITCTLHEVLLR
jgi:hypothetical protein